MRVDTAWKIVNGEEPFFTCAFCDFMHLDKNELANHLIKSHTEKQAKRELGVLYG